MADPQTQTRATDYAVACKQALAAFAAAQSTAPAPWTGSGLTASVTTDGGALLDRIAVLPPDQALALGQWLVSVFT